MNQVRNDIRNVAIIAHVDHGKTTLVDALLRQSGNFRESQVAQDCLLDSNPLERERGITILAKNVAINYAAPDGTNVKINLIDTPGHADFGGEVERVLSMADGAFLLVDAAEGPMPQTRFVLKKAFEHELRPIVIINKIDRPDQRANAVLDEVFDLFVELGADDEALDFPVLYASGRQGVASWSMEEPGTDIRPVFEALLRHVPAPHGDPERSLQIQITSIAYNDYVGRIGIGRIYNGVIRSGQQVKVCRRDQSQVASRVQEVQVFDGLGRKKVDEAAAGDVVALVNVDGTVAAIRGYDASGRMICKAPRERDPFGFTDGLDAGNGLWKLGARFYDSGKNAFIQQDRYLGDPSDPLSLNRYVYCGYSFIQHIKTTFE